MGGRKNQLNSFFVRFLSEFYWNFAAFKDWYLFKSAEWMFLRRCWFVILTWLIFSVNSRVIIATFWRYRNVIIWNLKLFRHGRIKNWKKKYILGLKGSNLWCFKLFSNWVATCMLRFEKIFAFEFYSFTLLQLQGIFVWFPEK